MKKNILYGAIIGDIVGSVKTEKTKDFELFRTNARYSDDTVLTLAIADALINVLRIDPSADEETFRAMFRHNLLTWGRRYKKVRYGRNFRTWLKMENPEPYGGNTNGSAMRVSSTGFCFESIERTRQVARNSAETSHNSDEGIRGAESVASAIFLARNGSSKDQIKAYIEEFFGYDLSRRLDDIRPTYKLEFACDKSVPEAIIAFLESNDFEDAIRNAISLGGDSDTLAAIAGSIAEAFYGVPQEFIEKVEQILPMDMINVIRDFNSLIDR